MEPKKLSVQEASNYLQARGFPLTPRTIREEIRAKSLRAYKIREVYYIDPRDLDAYIRERETRPSSEGEDLVSVP